MTMKLKGHYPAATIASVPSARTPRLVFSVIEVDIDCPLVGADEAPVVLRDRPGCNLVRKDTEGAWLWCLHRQIPPDRIFPFLASQWGFPHPGGESIDRLLGHVPKLYHGKLRKAWEKGARENPIGLSRFQTADREGCERQKQEVLEDSRQYRAVGDILYRVCQEPFLQMMSDGWVFFDPSARWTTREPQQCYSCAERANIEAMARALDQRGLHGAPLARFELGPASAFEDSFLERRIALVSPWSLRNVQHYLKALDPAAAALFVTELDDASRGVLARAVAAAGKVADAVIDDDVLAASEALLYLPTDTLLGRAIRCEHNAGIILDQLICEWEAREVRVPIRQVA